MKQGLRLMKSRQNSKLPVFFDCHPEAAAKLSTLYLPANLFKDAVCLHFPLKLHAALYDSQYDSFFIYMYDQLKIPPL